MQKAPFIIGVPRSGTTLLRLMLDSHPQMAIPPETHFLPRAAALPDSVCWQDLFRLIIDFETWPDFHLQEGALAEALQSISPFRVSEGLRAFYKLYAGRYGKPCWGDKTPDYGLHIGTLRKLFPEAHFLHLIRDGRDVACSLRPMWFAPSQDWAELARAWSTRIHATRSEGRGHMDYTEIRYEELVRNPEAALRKVCQVLNLSFHPEMLRYYERAPARLDEHEGRRDANGFLILTKDQRRAQQARTQTPPDASRIGHWKQEMSRADILQFENVAGSLLAELEYEL